MAEDKKPYPSRVQKKNRSNSILNLMIGLVFALILIVGAFIFLGQGNDNESAQEPESVQIAPETDEETSEEADSGETPEDTEGTEETPAEEESEDRENGAEEQDADNAEDQSAEQDKDENDGEDKDKEETEKAEEGSVTVGGTITREESDDPIVDETIINTGWEPIGTSQSGEHVSVYQEGHVDWKEKIDAITYATGLKDNEMYIMRIENGGGPQKAVGTVQSKDNSEKYRVHMEWVDSEGWRPVKMDVLKTLEGAY